MFMSGVGNERYTDYIELIAKLCNSTQIILNLN